MPVRGRKTYSNLAEFEREEVRPHMKCGFCLDDLYNDAHFRGNDDEPDEPKELDFDFGY
jgi:hypothetical protein